MPPRVLHVLPAVAIRYGGPSTAAIGMCRALDGIGVQTLLATTDADGPRDRLSVPTDRVVDYEGVPTIFFRRTMSESFKYSIALGRWLRAHVTDFEVVHIHAVFSFSSLSAARACQARGVPYVLRPLGTLDPWSLKQHAGRKRALLGLGAQRMLQGASRMHYTSSDEQRLAEGALPGLPQGRVIPLGIDEALFGIDSARGEASGRRVVSLCRLHPKKRIDLLIGAFHRLAVEPAYDSWSLEVAGDGDADYVAQLKRLAAEGPGAARITLSGWASPGARLQLLQSADLFVLPSHQENFGLAVAEALAAAVPVVVSPEVNLAPAILAAGAGWVGESTTTDLTATLRLAMANDAERGAKGMAARRLAGQFRWSSVARGLQALYQETVH